MPAQSMIGNPEDTSDSLHTARPTEQDYRTTGASESESQIVITRVHGTFASNAPWTRPDSTLERQLKSDLNGNVEFAPSFDWGGRNTHRARNEGAVALRETLEKRLEEQPDARHYVICHSHGGNVAMSAVGNSELLRDKIAGVVCLATPFFNARRRDFGESFTNYISGAIALIIILAVFLLKLVLPADWPEVSRMGVAFLTVIVIAVAMFIVFRQWLTYADQLLAELVQPNISPKKVLIVRSPGDEASGVLSFCQLISHLCVRLTFRFQMIYERCNGAAKRWSEHKSRLLAIAVGGFALFVAAIVVLVEVANRYNIEGWEVLAGFLGLIPLLLVAESVLLLLGWHEAATIVIRLAAATVIWPVVFSLSILLLPFGWQFAVANILLDVTAESTPLGDWTVHLVEPPSVKELRGAGPLIHSTVYENPAVLNKISEWIEEQHASFNQHS